MLPGMERATVYAIYFASLIFRESGLQDIFTSGQIRDRGGEQWTDRRLIYFRVLLNSRKAPTREIRENKPPAKYMAYTVCYSVNEGIHINHIIAQYDVVGNNVSYNVVLI